MRKSETKRHVDEELAADQQWQAIVKLAWRPAWSMRSRKGCLVPLIAWWRRRRADGASSQ